MKACKYYPSATNGKYDINLEHKSYRSLAERVRIRNGLVYNNSTYLECDAVVVTDDDGKVLIKVPTEVHNAVDDYRFGILPPLGRFHDGLEDMYEKFFYKYDEDSFSGNDLVIESA